LADVHVLPTLFGLALLGLVLAMARLRTGSLWVPIGIHATWVAAFRVGRLFFEIRSTPEWLMGPEWPPPVGGVAGWVAVAIAGVLLVRYVPAGRIFRL
jgi:membrane protease YdiL (CAAX protease family)